MNTSEKNWDDYSSDESSNEEINDVAWYQFPSAGKHSYKDDVEYSNKKPRLEELECIKPSTSGIKDNDYSNEPSNEESCGDACFQLSRAIKRCCEENGHYSEKRPRLDELELINPSTSGIASTSYNVESSTPHKLLHEFTYRDDYSSEESSDEESDEEEYESIQPSTSGVNSKVYNVESSAPKKTLHGITYQLRLLMLFVQRVPDGQEFFLSTEMHEAGYFDDVVLQYLGTDGIWRYRFLQAKHKNDDKFKIEIGHLFNKKSKLKKQIQLSKNAGESKPYLLEKYFRSYCDIEKNIDFRNAHLEEFLICTNVGFAENAMTYFECAEENDDDLILLNFKGINEKSTYPVKYRLKGENISELKEKFEINIKNENSFLKFLEKFRFLANYEDDKLNESIQNSLKECLNMENVILADAYIQNRVLKWFESYKDKKSQYLHIKNKKEFLNSLNKNIESLLVAGYSTFYIDELKTYGVQFENILLLREFFERRTGKIMNIITASPKLSIIKLSQLFKELELSQDEVIFTSAVQLNHNKRIFNTFVTEPSYKWLVIEYHHNEIKLSKKMLKKILDKEKTVVIIGREDHVLNFKLCLSFDTPCFYDENNRFEDLTVASQNRILETQVIFQSDKVTLNELIERYSGMNIIDAITLERLVTDTVEIGNNHAFISDFLVDDYYIPRKLIRGELRLDMLQNDKVLKGCLFIISGIDKNQLKDLNINNKWILIWEEGKTFKNGIILSTEIESKDIFNELCKHNSKNVCWLKYVKGKFLIMNISNYADILHKYDICLGEHDLSRKEILEKKIIIVADGPGCGKSVFLTKVAHHLKQITSNIWILRINLSSCAYKQQNQIQVIKTLEDIEFNDNETNKAIRFTAALLFPHEYKNFASELFSHSLYCLNKNMKFPKIILLFDGFDEISPTFKEKTLTLLKALRNSNVTQMWITARNHEEFSLEVALHSSSFLLSPINLTEKIIFLEKYWKYNLVNFDNIKPKPDSGGVLTYLREITDNICDCDDYFIKSSFSLLPFPSYLTLERLITSVDFSNVAKHLMYCFEYSHKDKISEFTGNPLQLKMIGEIIIFKKFISLDKLDIFSLYDEFIKYKWRVFRDDKDAAGKSVAGRNSFKIHLEYLTAYHEHIAFKILFPQHNNKEFGQESDKIELSRAGLLVIHDDRVEFVHRSFAEYFVSQYFTKYFKRKKIQKILFSDVLIKENYALIRKFLNKNDAFLDKLSSKTPQTIEIIRINNSDSKILYQMLEEDLCNLFVKFLENLPLDFSKNAIWFDENNDGRTVLHIICEYIKDEQILGNIFKTIKDRVSSETLIELFFKSDNQQRTALHCIHFEEENSIVKQKLQFFKLNCTSELFYKLLLQVKKMGDTILHMACHYGHDITYLLEVSEENRDAISKILLKTDNCGETALYKTILNSQNPSLVTALLNLVKSNCNSKEIKHLFATENDSRNLLHTACDTMNKDILVNFLNAFEEDTEMFQEFLLKTDKDGLSPLHYTMRSFRNLDRIKILLDFVNSKCSIETLHTVLCKRTRFGTTILHMAVENFDQMYSLHSLTPLLIYLFNLVKNHKDIFDELVLIRDHIGRTVLHYTSLELGSPSLVQDLIDFVQKNCSANILDELLLKLDENNANILHYVCRNDDENNLTFLLNTIIDKKDILKKLLFQTDSNGDSILHYLVLNFENPSMMSTLLNFVKINCEKEVFKSLFCKANYNGFNILHFACTRTEGRREYKRNLKSLLKFIEDEDTILNHLLVKTCSNGRTPLHYAISSFDNSSLINILFDSIKKCGSKILDILLLEDNNIGCNLLHFAYRCNKEESLTYLLLTIRDKVPVLNELILKGDREGRTILHYNVDNFEMLKFFLNFVKSNCGKEIFSKLILKCDKEGRTGLHTFCQIGDNEKFLTYLLNLVKTNTTPEVFHTFLSKKDCHGKVASDYIACNANSSSLLDVLLNFDFQLLDIVDNSRVVV